MKRQKRADQMIGFFYGSSSGSELCMRQSGVRVGYLNQIAAVQASRDDLECSR